MMSKLHADRILATDRGGIEEEIETLRNDLKTITGAAVRQMTLSASAGTRRGRPRTAAERKAQAQRMREIWAARKAQAVVNSASLKTAPSASAKVKTAAQRKAISLAMKEAWKRRKAAAAKAPK